MAVGAEVSSAATVDTGAGKSIALVQTSPDLITLHRIEDHELEDLMNIARPYSLALSTMSLGAFLGLLPSVLTVFDRAPGGLGSTDLIIVIVAGACIAAGAISGAYAVKGLLDADRAIKRIRARPTTPC